MQPVNFALKKLGQILRPFQGAEQLRLWFACGLPSINYYFLNLKNQEN